MAVNPSRKDYLRHLALPLAMGLVLLATLFLGACTTSQEEPAAVAPQPAATPSAAVTSNQPAQQPQQSQPIQSATAAPPSAGSASAPPAAAAAVVEAATTSGPPVQVVTTTNFVGDWARVVGGDRAEVFALLPPGGDPHSFMPGGSDVAKVADADVVFTVGLGLEAEWLHDLVHNAQADESRVIELGEVVDPMEFSGADPHGHGETGHEEHGHEETGRKEPGHEEQGHEEAGHVEAGREEAGHDEHGHEGHDHGPLDPHFWFDPIRVKLAVNEIAYRLAIQDPDNASVYDANATGYGEQLDELHVWIQEHVAMVPPERRLLVTSHDAFGYLAEAYGFQVVGLVIPSLAPDVEPSAEHLAELIEVVRENDVPAVFGETTVSDRLAQAITRETGAELVQLYSGSMGGPGSGADTYLGMVRANVERIVEALK